MDSNGFLVSTEGTVGSRIVKMRV